MVVTILSYLSLFILLGLAYLFLVKQAPANIPHGRMGWPLLGETLTFLKPHKSNTIGSFLKERCSRYGRVFRSHLIGYPTIVSCDHELNMFILQNEEKLFQVSYPNAVQKVLGELSMVIVSGDAHKRLRSSALGFTRICKLNPEYLDEMQKLMVAVINSWKSRKELTFYLEAKKLTFNIMVKQILSLETNDPQVSTILEDFIIMMKGSKYLPVCIPGTSYDKAVKASSRIHSTVKTIIRDRQGNLGRKRGDYLNVLLSNTSLCDEEKASVVFDLLLGGYETTSALMATIVYFLSGSPLALEKLKEEHKRIRERKDSEHLNWDDYSQMEFTQNVIYEALRCGNIVRFLHRKALKDVNFKGYFIPSGWNVLPMIAAVHLDPSLHENPSEFNPWRWTGQEKGKNVAPFGGGPRLCPGADIAKVETAFFLHHFVLNFRWRIKEDDYPMACPYIYFKNDLPIEISYMENTSRV